MAIYPSLKNSAYKLCFLLFFLLYCSFYSNTINAQIDIYYDNDEKVDSLIQTKNQQQKTPKQQKTYNGLVLGADYQFGIGNSIYIDFSPYIGYKFYNKISINFAIPYMYYYNTIYKESSHVVGARAFLRLRPAEYGFFRSLFIQGEAEYLSCYLGYNGNTNGPSRPNNYGNSYIKENASGFNIGFGYCSNFSEGFSATLLILYNLNYNNSHPVYISPLIYRLGFMYAF